MIKSFTYFLLLLFISFFGTKTSAQKAHNDIKWSELPSLPPAPGETIQPGIAGAFAGKDNSVLLLAGGANFPEGKPWDGGKKFFHDEIYVLKKSDNKYQWLTKQDFSLPYPVAYGASVSVPQGVVSIGGMNNKGFLDQVLLLSWNSTKNEVETKPLPALPVPMANMAAAAIDSKVYVAGGSTAAGTVNSFYRLDLNALSSGWKKLPSVPGPAFSHAVAVSQSNGEDTSIYLFGGRSATSSGVSELYGHSYVYNPIKNEWKQVSDIADKTGLLHLSAGTAAATGANYILLFGGDDGKIFHQIEILMAKIESSSSPSEKKKLQTQLQEIRTNHPGFSKKLLLYNTITDTWAVMAELPFSSAVTTTAVAWDDKIIIPSGEVAPGTRTSTIRMATITKKEYFTGLDYGVLAAYFILMILIGIWASGRQHSTNDYFRGGQRIPSWAAGLSIFGTQLSAITFMAVPAKTYATNWNYFFLLITIILVMPFIIKYFIPFFRKLDVNTAYEYLEKRFNYTARFLGSSLYILLQVGRLAIVLLLPSLALTLVTGIDVNVCIMLMGVITILYTVMGGIEAVIWTDVAQVIILLGGALVCIVLMSFQLDQNFSESWQTIQEYQKIAIFDFRFLFSEPTFWVVLIGGIAINLVTYGSDQTVVQRYLTTKNEKSAENSLRVGAWMALPAALIFFTIGTLLFLFYQENPLQTNIQLNSQDAIFPWYIVTQLPAGASGLLVAAIFSAAMSTLSSSMNSVSTAFISDFYQKFAPQKSEKTYLSLARVITVLIGIIGTGVALLMAQWGIASLWDQFNLILGLFTGGIGGIFLLGIFSQRANGRGAVIGFILSGIVQYFVKEYTNLHFLLYAFTGLISCLVLGYIFSLIFPDERKGLAGLTYKTIKEPREIN